MRRLAAACVVAIAACAAIAFGAAGSGAEPPSTATGGVRDRIGAWLPYWDRDAGLATLRDHGSSIGHLSPFWYELPASGRGITAHPAAGDPDVLQLARDQDIELVPTIANGWDRVRARRLLATPGRRFLHARALADLVEANDYAGLDVDYENLDPRDRLRFRAFLSVLAARLHVNGRRLTIAVPAYTSLAAEQRSAYDLAAIGTIVDEVRVMAYDQHWSCGSAGPVGSADWVERAADHVVTRVPAGKVVLGIPLYSYDWPMRRRGCAASHTWQELQAVPKPAVRRGWSPVARTPWLAYGRGKARRIVWFENAASTRAKARIAAEHGLRGVVLWRLGGEDPATWAALESELD